MSNREIEELEQKLEAAKAKHEARPLFPKWVEPDASHVITDANGNRIAPLFSEQHIDRVSSKLLVLVKDEDEEAVALAAKVEPGQEPKPDPVDPADAD